MGFFFVADEGIGVRNVVVVFCKKNDDTFRFIYKNCVDYITYKYEKIFAKLSRRRIGA